MWAVSNPRDGLTRGLPPIIEKLSAEPLATVD
jgi:hypothetical protein